MNHANNVKRLKGPSQTPLR